MIIKLSIICFTILLLISCVAIQEAEYHDSFILDKAFFTKNYGDGISIETDQTCINITETFVSARRDYVLFGPIIPFIPFDPQGRRTKPYNENDIIEFSINFGIKITSLDFDPREIILKFKDGTRTKPNSIFLKVNHNFVEYPSQDNIFYKSVDTKDANNFIIDMFYGNEYTFYVTFKKPAKDVHPNYMSLTNTTREGIKFPNIYFYYVETTRVIHSGKYRDNVTYYKFFKPLIPGCGNLEN